MISPEKSKRTFTLADHFRGGKYSPVQVRPVSVAALHRDKEDSPLFPGKPAPSKRPGTVQGTLSTNLSSQSDRGESDAEQRVESPDNPSGELSDEGPEAQAQLDELLDHAPLVEQRRVEVLVWEAKDLPIMDDEPGRTTDPYCNIILGETVKKTRVFYKNLEPVWNERFSLKVPLKAGETANDEFLVVDVMDWDQSAHDLVGRYKFKIGPRQDPFPEESAKTVVPRIAMSGTTTTTTVEGTFSLLDPEGQPVYGVGGRRVASLRLTLHHRHEVRHTSYRPSPEFLAAAATAPRKRTRQAVLRMTREVVAEVPAAALLSSKLVAMLCEIGELRRWKCREVVELQNRAASADSLHIVLAGRFTLHSQRSGPHMGMYRVLKSRSFGQSTSFGPKIGWRGPGEAFGEGAMVLEEGQSRTSVCMSEEGMTLRVHRRACERIMEQFRRRDPGYSRTLHGAILASDTEGRDVTTLSAYLKGCSSTLVQKLSDDSLAAMAGAGRLTRVEAGTVADMSVHGDCVHILCAGTVAVLQDSRSDAIVHGLPVCGECIDVLGPGGTFGVRGGNEKVSLLARESADFLSIPRGELMRLLMADEAHSRLLASPEAMVPRVRAPGGGARSPDGQRSPLRMARYASMKNVAKSLSFKKLYRPVRTPVAYVMAVFHRLRGLHGLQQVPENRLWLLAQSGKLVEFVSGPGKVEGGAAVVLKGVAELKEFTAAEKPADDGGERRVVREGDTVLGGTEVVCSGYVAMYGWEPAEWAYATEHAEHGEGAGGGAAADGGAEPLSCGRDGAPACELGEVVAALEKVPILREVPRTMMQQLAAQVRSVAFPDGAVPLADGEQDGNLYVVRRGRVAVYQDREQEDAVVASQLRGSDVLFHASYGAKSVALAAGDAFSQVEFVTGAKSCLTAVCRGPTELLVLPAESLSSELRSIVLLCIERSPQASGEREPVGSKGELEVLRMLQELEQHSLRELLSWKATNFLCGHMQRVTLEAGEEKIAKDAAGASVLAVLSGKVAVYAVGSGGFDPKGTPMAMLRSGDVFEGHHTRGAEELLGGLELRLVAVAREESQVLVVDSAQYRAAQRKTLADAVVSARLVLMRIPLFGALPLFLFERLARLAKWRTLKREERCYWSDSANDRREVTFLTTGEFKVTSRLPHSPPLALLGPGCCFGEVDTDGVLPPRDEVDGAMEEKRAPPASFAVFASSDAAVLQIPNKELQTLLPADTLSRLHEELRANAAMVARSTDAEAPSARIAKAFTDSPLAPSTSRGRRRHRAARERSASLSSGGEGLPLEELQAAEEEDWETNPPPRVRQDADPWAHVAFQTGLTSGGMASFFENVANGKVTPLHEAQSRAPMGRPPEEVLPSLRPQFLKEKIALIQHKAHLDALRPKPAEATLSPRGLARLDARKKGLKVLQRFQGRVEQLRKDDVQRKMQEERAAAIRRERKEAQMLRDFMAMNKDLMLRPADTRRGRAEKEATIEAAMVVQRERNAQREAEKAARASQQINRKEVNDQRHIERVQALRRRSAVLKRAAVWLMLGALGQRMAAWRSTFAYVRSVREDFGIWVAAAISIQRRFRKHVYGVVRKRKAEAVALVIKNFRIYSMMLRIERKKRGAPVIATFLREYVAQMHDVRFHFRMFRNNVRRIQRFWRLSQGYLALINAVVMRNWDQVEYKVRKEEAERLRKEDLQGRGKGRPPPPAKKLDAAVPPLPMILKLPQVWSLTRELRVKHTELKASWKTEFQEWVSREEYRVLIQREKSLLQGGGDVARDIMLERWLDEDDPPPRCPILNPVPSTEVLDKAIRETFVHQAKTAAEARARGKGRASPLQRKRR